MTTVAVTIRARRLDWRQVLPILRFARRLGIKTLEYYQGALHGMVADLFDGDMTQDAFESLGYQLIDDQVTEAWFEGIGRNGFDIENMTSDWWDHLNGIIAREQDYFSGFADDIASLRKEPDASLDAAFARADLYAQRYIDIENQAWLYTSAAAETFVWALGGTEEHCPECSALDGWVATSEEWQQSGINPQMPPNDMLTCGGWRCDCRLEKTDAPSMGDPRDALAGMKHLKGDVAGHEFHGNQHSGGGGSALKDNEYRAARDLGLPTKYTGSDSRPAYAGEAVDNPLPQATGTTYDDIPGIVKGLHNVDYETTSVPISDLRSAQDYVQPTAVKEYYDKMKDGSLYAVKPIVVKRGGENVIINGNHQIVAAQLTGQTSYEVRLYGS